MSNYTQTTFFAPKDSLPINNPGKTIFGAAYDVEFANLATAVNSKSNISGGNAFTGAQTITGTSGTILQVAASSGSAIVNISGSGPGAPASLSFATSGGTASITSVGAIGFGAVVGDLNIISGNNIDFTANAGTITQQMDTSGFFHSYAGILGTTGNTASTASGTPVTIFTAVAGAVYLVMAYTVGQTNPASAAVAYIVKALSTGTAFTALSTASNLSLTTSGLLIQLTQTTGGAAVMTYDVLRVL